MSGETVSPTLEQRVAALEAELAAAAASLEMVPKEAYERARAEVQDAHQRTYQAAVLAERLERDNAQLEMELRAQTSIVDGLREILKSRPHTVSGRTAALEMVLQAARLYHEHSNVETLEDEPFETALGQAIRLADALAP